MSDRLTEGGVARLGAVPVLGLVPGRVLGLIVRSSAPRFHKSHPTPSSRLEVKRSPCWSPTLIPTSPSAGCPATCRATWPTGVTWPTAPPPTSSRRLRQGRGSAARTGRHRRQARTRLGAARPRLTAEIDELEAEITELVKHLARSLLAICGCGPLAAAKILGETAGVDRFRSKHVYARHTGTAPLPVGHPTERATVWSPDAKPQAMAAWKPCTSSNADYPMSSTAP